MNNAQTQTMYLLIPEKESASIERDLEQLVVTASSYDVRIKAINPTTLEFVDGEEILRTRLEAKKDHILLITSRTNKLAIQCVREIAATQGYRTFSLELGCFIPNDPYIRDLITFKLDNTTEEILLKKGIEPLFTLFTGNKDVIYAQIKGHKEVHILNPFIIEYYKVYGYDEDNIQEFNYEVSPDRASFAALFDAGLIPVNFYERYRRVSKIRNYSHINITNPKRKIFVKPLILELSNRTKKFYIKGSDKGSMVLMDKIRQGETLHDTLVRFLKENDLADDYIGAIVQRDIEFDRDREGRLTPRITVLVYTEKLKNVPRELKRSWIPTPKD